METYIRRKNIIFEFSLFLIFFSLSFSFLSKGAYAGEFRVTPIMIDLDRGSPISVTTVINDSSGKLNFQMRAFEWTQDKDGKDRYVETDDLVFFPRIMTVMKDERKTIRVGMKNPATEKEKTYRLFIEEIPEKKERTGFNISIAIRFGVPIFVKPAEEEVKADIERLSLSDGTVTAVVRNTGNTHLSLDRITFKGTDSKGEELFTESLKGWYLLHGVARQYSSELSMDTCKRLTKVHVEVVSDKLSVGRDLDIMGGTCASNASKN